MSADAGSRLPARPSLEQLKKQAKERLATLRESDPSATLSQAQLALAREYAFASWPKLVAHVEGVRSDDMLARFRQLAEDYLAGYDGDEAAIQRLITFFGVSYSVAQAHQRLIGWVDEARGTRDGKPTLDDVRLLIARKYGHETWQGLAEGLAQPAGERAPHVGLSAGPPFYRIDWKEKTIEPRPPLSERDWETVFAVMEEHGLTGIASAAFTDRALELLSRQAFVTRVRTDGCGQISDDGVLHLARMTQLEDLDLSGWHSRITDRGLAALRHLTSLRRIQMSWPQRITDAGTVHLAHCDRLEDVNLLGTPTGDATVAALRGKRALRRLTTGKMLTDRGLASLHDIPAFKTWSGGELTRGLTGFEDGPTALTIDGPFTNAGLAQLSGLDGLASLGFFWHAKAFDGEGLAVLRDLPHLQGLLCDGDRCDDAAMRHIAALPGLRQLAAQGTVATDDGFTALARSQSIEHVWGRECPNLTGRGFRALAAMPRLWGLAVSCKSVDDAALATLPSFPALTFLMPMDVSDHGFRHVGRCARLEALWCMYCRDTGDVATEHVKDLGLKLYYAGKTRITDASLMWLGAMDSLETVQLWETAAVTDAGVAALARLPHLRELSISGAPRVTRAGVAGFRAEVRVDFGS